MCKRKGQSREQAGGEERQGLCSEGKDACIGKTNSGASWRECTFSMCGTLLALSPLLEGLHEGKSRTGSSCVSELLAGRWNWILCGLILEEHGVRLSLNRDALWSRRSSDLVLPLPLGATLQSISEQCRLVVLDQRADSTFYQCCVSTLQLCGK